MDENANKKTINDQDQVNGEVIESDIKTVDGDTNSVKEELDETKCVDNETLTTSNVNKTEQPDSDCIKMFVGQIPKTMDEKQLLELFEAYGRVFAINILRDKYTGISKGCCFVTFYKRRDAVEAQGALHNLRTLKGMHHPIQMKPADSENKSDRKLFVGMLNKKYNEQDVRQLFSGQGTIEECTVLRDQNGQSKGCAFVTFANKQSAVSAIKTLHQSQTMEGCSAPLVVKFADTQKEKEQKKLHQMHLSSPTAAVAAAALSQSPAATAIWNFSTANLTTPPSLTQSAATIQTPLIANTPQQANPYLAADAITPQIHLLQQLQAGCLHQHLLQGLNNAHLVPTDQPNVSPVPTPLLNSLNVQNYVAMTAMAQQQPLVTSAQSPLANGQLASVGSGLWPTATDLGYTNATIPHLNGTQYISSAPISAPAMANSLAMIAGKQIEGPEGCNLFIYHLPAEFTDSDLATTFLPFGNIVSAKVFIDKQTNLSKCFGFVSFDNANSAQSAIQAMHGFQIGPKRLKVQLKRSRDAAKPY